MVKILQRTSGLVINTKINNDGDEKASTPMSDKLSMLNNLSCLVFAFLNSSLRSNTPLVIKTSNKIRGKHI